MKKSILIMLVVFVFIGTVSAEEKFDGYAWEKLDKNSKMLLITGFITGHKFGVYEGFVEGYKSGQFEIFSILKKEMNNTELNKNIVDQSFEGLRTKIINDEIPLPAYVVTDPLRRVEEFEAFYKTFPLCKSKTFPLMLSEILKVWKNDRKTTYKEIGEKCAEGN